MIKKKCDPRESIKDLSTLDLPVGNSKLEVKVSQTDEVTEITISEQGNDALAKVTGTQNEDLAKSLIIQLQKTLPAKLKQDGSSLNAAIALLQGIAPRDELEGALGTQMVAIHNASIEMLRRAMLEEQLIEGVNSNINRAVKLSRMFTAQIEALQKYRSKGQQTIQVQHVQVNEGGQAIVGNVKTGDRDNG